MDPTLMEVAKNGDIDGLYGLLRNNPFILDNVEKTPFTDTPLHLAVSDGHTCSVEEIICFVEEITNLKPSFIWKLNQDGFSPLHLASSSGQLEIVKVLLKDERRLKKLMEAMNVDGSLYTLKGKEKRTPLHCAAIAGCVDVLEELLSNCPDSITALTVRKETALHLAVKFDQVEAFKVLVNWTGKRCYNGILRWKDQEGNTVLHLATSRAQYEMVNVMLHSSCLLVRNAVKVNARNNAGQTALDLLPSGPDQEKTGAILCSVGAKEGHEIESQQVPAEKGKEIEGKQVSTARSCVVKWLPKSSKIKHWLRYFRLKVDKDTPPDTRNALLVVVVLIVTATFQTGLNPPGGYWTETNRNDTRKDGGDMPHYAGEPIWSTYAPGTYDLVMLFNFAGFILSVVLTYNLTQGYPLRGPLLVALIFMVLTYSWSTPIFDYEGIPNGPARRDFGNDPASSDIANGLASSNIADGPASSTVYFLNQNPSNNKMLWLPVVLVVIIWAITANWMRRICWKFWLFTGRSCES